MAKSFTRMDQSTADQWAVIGTETVTGFARTADSMISMLESLASITDGFSCDQLTHCLQTATRAERAGASEEVVFASLMHDVGKAVSTFNHPAIAAEMIKPFVGSDTYNMIKAHQDFQGKHYYHHFNADPDSRDKYAGEPWYDLCATFADEWDQTSFDPDYDTLPLSHFEPLIRTITAAPTSNLG